MNYREKNMARKVVVAIECARCQRVEHIEGVAGLVPEAPPALTISLRGADPVVYDDLCTNCMEIVMGAITNLTKPMEKKSPIRKRKTPEEAAAEYQAEARRKLEGPPPQVQPMRVPRG